MESQESRCNGLVSRPDQKLLFFVYHLDSPMLLVFIGGRIS